MEPWGERPIDSRDLAHRRAVAWRLYERAAADRVRGRPAAALRAAAARLQALAARLETPEPALAPVVAIAVRPRPKRTAC